jgi:hypothetical protein
MGQRTQHREQSQQRRSRGGETATTPGGKHSTPRDPHQIIDHLGPVAAACLFIGCKMEEEPRRIRDVINLSSLLHFSSADDEDFTIIGQSCLDAQEDQLPKKPSSVESNDKRSPVITITEGPHPPPLDESYWTAKEQMVSMEQHVLRMLRFDTTVCHPHRCVLLMMETLGFGTGIDHTGNRNNDNHEKWLLNSSESEYIILRAFNVLNEVPLDPGGIALHYPVMVLSCAAISLAADDYSDGRYPNTTKDIDAYRAATLPALWWRALDVSTSDITIAKKALIHLLH